MVFFHHEGLQTDLKTMPVYVVIVMYKNREMKYFNIAVRQLQTQISRSRSQKSKRIYI